jgi:tetratricopeptide (TPR) repeat protein
MELENYPDNKDTHFQLALIYKLLRKFDDSLSEINEILKIDPKYADAYDLRGNIYEFQGDAYYMNGEKEKAGKEREKAIKEYTDALRYNPKLDQCYYYRALCYGQVSNINLSGDTSNVFSISITESDKRKIQRILDDLTHAIQINGNDTNYYQQRAGLYFILKKHTEAIRDYKKGASMGSILARKSLKGIYKIDYK